MFANLFMGVVRTTFVIDGDGIVRNIFRVRRVAGHADDVEAAVKALP
jgi:peroxiredoxin Q/BCP